MNISLDKVTEIFYLADEFCNQFKDSIEPHLVGNAPKRRPRMVDDREPFKNERFLDKIKGKLYGDKGYLSTGLTNILFVNGLHLVTNIRNNMKNCLMEMKDKTMFGKRSVIETINDELKNMCQVEHSRHRSFGNFITNLLSGLIAYSFFPKKPAIKYETVPTKQVTLF